MIVRYGLALLMVSTAACGKAVPPGGQPERESVRSSPDTIVRTPVDSRPAIVFLGTSLTAGYGLADPATQAYPALLQAKLDSAGRPYRVMNAGLSGESSAGALNRIDWLLSHQPVAVLVVETGANDALRGQDPDSVRARIQAIFDRARRVAPSSPPRLLVLGMEALPNLGPEYGRRFRVIYSEVARANGAALVPFLLAGVGGVDSLNQEDGVHPTAAGHRIMAENVWKVLERVTR